MVMSAEYLNDVRSVLDAAADLEQIASITASTLEHNNEIDRARDHFEACVQLYALKWIKKVELEQIWNASK